MRRVVVTGLGAVSPLGVGVRLSWGRLLQGHSGVTAINDPSILAYNIPCKVAAYVPRLNAAATSEGTAGGPDLSAGLFDSAGPFISREARPYASTFVQFALKAAAEAVGDAGWSPGSDTERERAGVAFGSGIGSVEDIVEAAKVLDTGGYRRTSVYVMPRILVNSAAGQVGGL